MMRFKLDGVLAETGTFGPFNDGRTLRFVDVLDQQGGGILRATAAQDLPAEVEARLDTIPPASPVTVDLELYGRDGKAKLRFHGLEVNQQRKAA